MSLEVFGPGKGKKKAKKTTGSSPDASQVNTHQPRVVIPMPGVPQAARKAKWKSWIGPCASIACLIHCFALPFVLLAVPPFVHTLSASWIHQMEWVFWAVAFVLGLYTMKHASAPRWSLALFAVIAMGSPIALIQHNHDLAHLALMLMASYQFIWVVRQHLNAKYATDIECCDHNH